MFKASQIICREIADTYDWNFTGSFDDFNIPEAKMTIYLPDKTIGHNQNNAKHHTTTRAKLNHSVSGIVSMPGSA